MPSYEQNAQSKRWSVRFRDLGPDGKVHQKRLSGYKTKREARLGYETYCANQGGEKNPLGSPADSRREPSDMLFSELAGQYMNYIKRRIKASSYYDISSRIRNRILPFFSEMPVCDIKPATILLWEQRLEDQGYSYSYRASLFSHLCSVFHFGSKYMDIEDITSKVDRPRNMEPKKEMKFWTPEQFARFISKVDKPVCAAYFWLLYVVGCRRGEGAALTWADIDTARGTVSITKSVTNKAGAPYKVTTPKNNASNRTVRIPPFLCTMLEEHKNASGTPAPDAFVFGGTEPLPHTTVTKVFQGAIRKSGVEPIRIHDLRHSCASYLISQGVSIVAVSKRLGHSDIEQTLNTYSHMMPSDESIMLSALEAIAPPRS